VRSDAAVYRQEVQDYLYVMAVPAVFIFLLALAFFPSRPPTPPSTSSTEER
jgi:hypothetical protein